MAFNFDSLANTKPANTISYLKPYDIYGNITIKSTEVKEGVSDTGKAWKSLNVTFGNEEGIFSHSIFYFDEKDTSNWERRSADMPNGGKRELPSKAEELQNTIAAIGFAFFPEDFKKLQGIVGKIKTTEQLMEYFKKLIDKNIDKNPTNMKLVGRESEGRVYAALPKFTGIAQAKDEKRASENGVQIGQWYTWMISPFNSNPERLTFSSFEQGKADSYHNATPTSVGNSQVTTDPINNFDNNTGSEDIDFESLL